MSLPRFAYRARQFWNAVLRPKDHVKNETLLPYLSPAEVLLFRRMQPSEQAHAWHVFQQLTGSGQTESGLLTAALLHDVGKILSPLSVFDRVLIVVGRYVFPRASRRWGEGQPRGLRRPFVVAACHPAWGADLLKQAGASELVMELVRRHHEPPAGIAFSRVEQLLAELHAVDDQN